MEPIRVYDDNGRLSKEYLDFTRIEMERIKERYRLNKKESGEWFFQKRNYSNSIPILYVHLLQNLFYALFQEELNIIFQ